MSAVFSEIPHLGYHARCDKRADHASDDHRLCTTLLLKLQLEEVFRLSAAICAAELPESVSHGRQHQRHMYFANPLMSPPWDE